MRNSSLLWETMGIRLRCGLLLDRRRGVRRSTLCGKVVRVSSALQRFIRRCEIPYRSRARKPCSASSNYSNYSNYFDPKQYARTDNYSSLESSSPCASHSSRLSINRINRSPIHESRKYESKVLLEAHLPRNTATIRV